MTTARDALLEASLNELSEQLCVVFEFCEATMTRALDVAPLRKGELFSAEEHRSLRGISQAQWLLQEAAAKRERQTELGKGKKGKKKTRGESSL